MENITVDNYLQHLNELTDEQITEFLDKDPNPTYRAMIDGIREDLRTTPKEQWSQLGLLSLQTDRGIAESLQNF